MKRLAFAVAALVLMASTSRAQARRAAPPASAAVVQLVPERFALESSVLVDLAVDGLAGRLAFTRTSDGYRVDAIASDSSLNLLGLAVGDVVRSINGVALTNRAALRKAHAVARTSRLLQVEATRGGAPLSLRYRIVSSAGRVSRFAQPQRGAASRLLALMRPGVKRTDATHIAVDRAVLEALEHAGRVFGDALDDPHDGLVVYRAGSLLELLGLELFDDIAEVDGNRVISERSLLRSLADAAGSKGFAVAVQRNGARVVIQYTVVQQSFDATDLRAAAAPPPSLEPSDADAEALAEAMDKGVKKRSDVHYVVDRRLLDLALANPMAIARGARIVPSIKNGVANGFKLYAIRPSSIYARVGFMNGDNVHSINGMDLSSPDKALEVYAALRATRSMRFEISRRGKPVTLRIDIK